MSILGIGLYCLPLMCQIVKSEVVRASGLWLGVFLVLQTGVTFYLDDDYKTLPPGMRTRVIVGGDPVRRNDGAKTLTTDRMGFRTSGLIDYRRKAALRIFAIGGSTTHEPFIDDRDTWTYLLHELLRHSLGRPVETINTGLAGLRARHHLATLRTIIPYQPDIVIFLVGINDWNHHIQVHFGSKRPDSAHDLRQLYFRNTLLAKTLRQLPVQPVVTPVMYWQHKLGNSLRLPDKRVFRPTQVLPAYDATLAKISDTCHEAGITCVFATQPHAYLPNVDPLLKARFWMTPTDESYTVDFESAMHIASLYNRRLIAFGKARNHLVCDIAPAFEPTFDNFIDECHFNESGSRRVAEELGKCLTDHRLQLRLETKSSQLTWAR